MTHTINAYRQGEPSLILQIRSDLPSEELRQAVRDAVKDFLEDGGHDAENTMSATCDNFNWGDLALWLPDRFARMHGFTILDATAVAGLTVDHDESLLPDGFEYAKGE